MNTYDCDIDFLKIKSFSELRDAVINFDYEEDENNIYIVYNNTIKKVDSIEGISFYKNSDDRLGNIVIVYNGTRFRGCNIFFGKKSGLIVGYSKYEIRNVKYHMQWSVNNIIRIGRNFSSQGVAFKLYSENIYIGNECMFSWGITIFSGDGHYIYDESGKRINENEEVIIGNHVWCCCDAKILKGTTVMDNSVIATDAVVSKKYHDEGIIIGGFGEILKKNIEWSRRPKK
ncbi:MAG: hypothetical protein PUB69_00630 [Desulfovibrionaceae bacterium]|nr:hypothetical protein [Desulfovibrionaceae bacterium]